MSNHDDDEGPAKWHRWIDEMENADRETAEAWRKNRPAPTSQAGREWRRAEEFSEKLAETGDTPKSFFVKGVLGCAGMAGVAGVVLWLAWRALRAAFGWQSRFPSGIDPTQQHSSCSPPEIAPWTQPEPPDRSLGMRAPREAGGPDHPVRWNARLDAAPVD